MLAGARPSLIESQPYTRVDRLHSALPDGSKNVESIWGRTSLSALEAYSRDEAHELSRQAVDGLPDGATPDTSQPSELVERMAERIHRGTAVPTKVVSLEVEDGGSNPGGPCPCLLPGVTI